MASHHSFVGTWIKPQIQRTLNLLPNVRSLSSGTSRIIGLPPRVHSQNLVVCAGTLPTTPPISHRSLYVPGIHIPCVVGCQSTSMFDDELPNSYTLSLLCVLTLDSGIPLCRCHSRGSNPSVFDRWLAYVPLQSLDGSVPCTVHLVSQLGACAVTTCQEYPSLS